MKRITKLPLATLLLTLTLASTSTRINANEFELRFPSAKTIEQSVAANKQSSKAMDKSLLSSNEEKLGPMLGSMLSGSIKSKQLVRQQPLAKTKNGSLIQIYVSLNTLDEYDLQELQGSGLIVEISNATLKKVQGWADPETIELLLESDNVISITLPNYASNRAGSVQSEGDRILRANLLRDRGFEGQGVKVGVVSDGSNAIAIAQASGNLPPQVTQFGSCSGAITGSTCNEGTAMAEIIHDIAPQAELAIGAVSTSLEFIQRINQLANVFRADIIVDDLGFLTEPYFQDGDLAQAVTALPSRVLYVSAAGNSAETHYEADYRGISSPLASIGTLHDFGAVAGQGSQEALGFAIPPGATSCVILQWNEPFDGAISDYDLIIIDQNGAQVDASLSGGPFAFEAACSTNTTSELIFNFALVNRFSGSNRRIEMLVTNTGPIQFPVAQGSIFGHAATNRALAVGTINVGEPGNDLIASFSSQGPSRVDFPRVSNRPKPDITGIDGVSVSGAGGFPSTFFGTSAAAPHIAALAAQLMSSNRLSSAKNVKDALTSGAIDLGAIGRDNVYGFGRADAVNAEALLIGSAPIAPLFLLLDDE